MLICNRGDCAPPESRQYVRRHECEIPENRQYGAKSSGDMTGRIRVDRGRGIYVHETDKKSIDELKRKKVDRRSRSSKRVDRRSVRSGKKVDRRQAGVASKDQIQQGLLHLWLVPWCRFCELGSVEGGLEISVHRLKSRWSRGQIRDVFAFGTGILHDGLKSLTRPFLYSTQKWGGSSLHRRFPLILFRLQKILFDLVLKNQS